MSIDLAGANAYFSPGNHLKAEVWAGFDEDQPGGAVAQAKRVLARMLCDGIEEEATTDGDFPRHDLAVYEQACYLLQASPSMADGTYTGPKWAIPEEPMNPHVICADALAWLAYPGQITISRG